MKTYIKNIHIIITFSFLQLQFLTGFEIKEKSNPGDTLVTASFTAVGDIMCHSTQYNYAKTDSGGYNFNPVFDSLKSLFISRDVLIGNLETVTAGEERGISGYPVFNSPDSFVESLAENGFDILVTSNNHCLDKGRDGLLRTKKIIKQNKMISIGSFNDPEERDSIILIEKNGMKFSLLAYTYATNGKNSKSAGKALVSVIDTVRIKTNISNSRSKGAEIVIVYLHFGKEYQREPNEYQRRVVRSVIDSGVDIIIASHPHVIQPVEMFKTKNATLDSGFVAYSLGNFISNQRWRYSDCAVAMNFTLSKNSITDSIYLTEFTYLPLWVFKGKIGKKPEYKILPSEIFSTESIPEYLNKQDLKLMKESYEDTKAIINKHSNNPRLLKVKDLP